MALHQALFRPEGALTALATLFQSGTASGARAVRRTAVTNAAQRRCGSHAGADTITVPGYAPHRSTSGGDAEDTGGEPQPVHIEPLH